MKRRDTSLVESGELRVESENSKNNAFMQNNSQFSILNSQLALLFALLIMMVQTVTAQTVEQHFSFTIKTANTDSVFQKIIQTAESKGGYFTHFSENALSIRLPVEALQEFQTTLGDFSEIADKSFSSTDKNAELERLNSQIESRKKLLQSYMDLVKNAPFSELQSVEREMVNLNAQIERLQGQKQAIERRAALASININASYLSYQPVQPIINTHSPFKWINSTNLSTLRGDF